MQGSVTVHMSAPAQDIWELVSDVAKIGLYSPETFEAEWTGGATGPAVGATFRGHVKRNGRGPVYWTDCTVTECEPGKAFGFNVGAAGATVNNWRYELTPTDGGGTDVTESFRLENRLPMKAYWLLFGKLRGKTNEDGMRQTLERIKAVAES
ncbi:MAG: Polyketide cyclase / dehydrase and lipid transport [Frankiales bacterium]|nr:Polyketide cyclase / dehydrase and lipid transport [Frankiales bacterium]